MTYQQENAHTTDRWCAEGWIWGIPITHETYLAACRGTWDVYLTPTKPVPHEWFGTLRGKRLLGLASGGGQQIPIFSALGAYCTVLDLSAKQCESERLVAEREGYQVRILQEDMTRPLPFPDESFDLIFHPVSNCYIENPEPVFRECFRILKPGGVLIGGYDTGINYLFDESEECVVQPLPFNPLRDPKLYEESLKSNSGIQFSHTVGEQLGGQLRAGFLITDVYDDTNGTGRLHEFGVPTFLAVRAQKPAACGRKL